MLLHYTRRRITLQSHPRLSFIYNCSNLPLSTNAGRNRDIMISKGRFRRCSMAQFVVRNIEDAVKLQLQRRAAQNGRSMEEEVREILRSATNEENVRSSGV